MRRAIWLGAILLGFGLCAIPRARAAQTHYVGPNRPYTTIQSGIDAASDGDTVMVDSNTAGYPAYVGAGNQDIDFGGKAITVQSVGGPTQCIIDVQDGSGHRGFLFHSGETSSSVLNGFTIKRAKVTNTADGAGIRCTNGSSPRIEWCIITDNHAGGKGGGIYCDDSSPTIEYCEISYNYAGGSGSGGGNGGGIACINGASPTVRNSGIFGNESDKNGGGVWMNLGCSPTFEVCSIYSNRTLHSNGDGGGVHVAGSGSAPVFTQCRIYDNDAPYGHGGGLNIDAAFVKFVNCVLNTNHAGGSGGGALLVYGSGANLEVRNSTVYGNLAGGFGGGFYVNGNASMSLTIKNSILWGNKHVGYGSSYSANQIQKYNNPVVGVTHCCVEGGWTGTGNITGNPKLLTDGYHLDPNASPASSCIDKGNNGDVVRNIDIDGNVRIQGSAVDIGADELR